ncbi:Kelch repeat and BTB domain-containing protein 2 [Trebouxia sp. C0009 RCD-2024]
MDQGYFGVSSPEFQNMADALLVVEDKQLPVHKAILAASSPTFTTLFTSCSATTREDGRLRIPLDDSLLSVCATLRYLYHGCTKLRASKLQSFDDAYHVITFAHKYNMRGLLEECEADLVGQAMAQVFKFFGEPGTCVRWTLLAEKCEMSTLLAHCEAYMAQRTVEAFWSSPAEKAMQLSSTSLLRMLKAASYYNNHQHLAPLKMFIAWQQDGQDITS